MTRSIERAIDALVARQEPITVQNVITAYFHVVNFSGGGVQLDEAMLAFEHALDKHPLPVSADGASYCYRPYVDEVDRLRRDYWAERMGGAKCTCGKCGCPIFEEQQLSQSTHGQAVEELHSSARGKRKVKGGKRKAKKRVAKKRLPDSSDESSLQSTNPSTTTYSFDILFPLTSVSPHISERRPRMEATLDSPEWKNLLAEKQRSPDLIKASARTPADFSRLPGRLLQNIALVQALYTFGTGSSRSLHFVGASIRRKISELQAEIQLRRLFARTKDYLYGGHEPNGKTMVSIRSEWTQLQSLVLEGRFSTKTQSKVIRLRAECVSTQLSAQASPPPHGLYEDLLDLVRVICTYPVTESLQRKVWGILLQELHKGSARHLVAAVDAESRDTLLILRHLAACKLAVWCALLASALRSAKDSIGSPYRRSRF
ncbi:hypothetical protein NM688_g6868 [Phlebia brevispora]|uniref:Uncharacterized protein n=1 Tax=Phlebia brevispora TaxID=194682 RepID=A0ACC1SBJ5_9APHY|nr:hypothetical protein NM688_g6868 [Phlebia brevispora]